MKNLNTAKKAAIIILFFLILIALYNQINHDNYTDVLIDNSENHMPLAAADLNLDMTEAGSIKIEKLWDENGNVMLTLSPVSKGEARIDVSDQNHNMITTEYYKIGADGVITNLKNGNFSGYRVSQLLIILLITALTILLFWECLQEQRLHTYSYHAIFCIGLGLWLAAMDAVLIYGYACGIDMLNVYAAIKNGAAWFMTLSFPLLLAGALLLVISNIRLIQKEGPALINFLGIVVSFLVIGGWAVLMLMDRCITSGSEFEMDVRAAIESIFFCLYALLEGFVLGAVICGNIATHKKPKGPVDYMIILGCKIADDGTLYPLIRGRADKAIAFGKAQIRAGGPKLKYVPSGGKGQDECLSEGEAMRRYLIAQGVEDNRIFPETKAGNTRENMIFSKQIIDALDQNAKIAFATTNYHVFRSGIIARQCGYDFEGIASKTKWYFWPNAYVREVVGMLSYKWKTLLLLLLPIAAFFISVQFMF